MPVVSVRTDINFICQFVYKRCTRNLDKFSCYVPQHIIASSLCFATKFRKLLVKWP